MSISLAAVVVSSALALQPASGLRIANPNDVAVDATILCAGVPSRLHLEAHGVHDMGACSEPSLETPMSLVALETGEDDAEWQRLLSPNAACEPLRVDVPLFGCKFGLASAAVPRVEGASYEWTVEGGAILSGAGTDRIGISIGDVSSVTVTAKVTGASCSSTSAGVISVREPIVISTFTAPPAINDKDPVTLTWTYANNVEPASQLLSGDAFAAPVVLDRTARTYTFTPPKPGIRTIELRASYAQSIATKPSGRRRAVGSTLVTATHCPSAMKTSRLEIRGCAVDEKAIHAPEEVEDLSTFTASVELESGETAQWSVNNGELLTRTGPEVEVVALGSGELRLEVHVVQTEGKCFADASRNVRVAAIPECPQNPPTATVEAVSSSCDYGVVKATFTGTPPFRGTWSDGTELSTDAFSVTREVHYTGQTTIHSFRDKLCRGRVSGSAGFDHFGPTVSLTTVGGNCTNSKIVAHFSGTPPFKGMWNDSQYFTTNETSIEREPGRYGGFYIDHFTDASCTSWPGVRSNSIDIGWPPSVEVQSGPTCRRGDGTAAQFVAFFHGGFAPYTVEWDDGVISTSTSPFGGVVRDVKPPEIPRASYRIVRASSATCDATILANDTVRTPWRPHPEFVWDHTDSQICPKSTATAEVEELPRDGGVLHWIVDGGEILSGQGTTKITFRITDFSTMRVKLETLYPDGECNASTGFGLIAGRDVTVKSFDLSPETIHAGGIAHIQFTLLEAVNDVDAYLYAPQDRYRDLYFHSCEGVTCHFSYADSIGPGTVRLQLGHILECTNGFAERPEKVLTIVP